MSNVEVSRREVLQLAGSVACLAFAPAGGAASANYPSKPVKLIVPFPPGGPIDTLGRLLAAAVGERIGQTIVVENRPGVGGNLGTDVVAKSASDGYTLALSGLQNFSVAPHIFKKMPYDPERDFTFITRVVNLSGAIVAHPSAPFSNLSGLIAYAKANPGRLAYGSAGIGTTGHLAGAMLTAATGIQLQHVPYKGTVPMAQDLLGGQILLAFESSLASAVPNIRSGKLKGIAVLSSERSSLLPDLPTVAESGVPGFEFSAWMGLVGPANLQPDVVDLLNKSTRASLGNPEVVAKLSQFGLTPVTSTPQQFSEFVRSETVRWGRIVAQAKITAD
jgi:tripartite-type tricarboxylate transporter receptor subunit TctC